MSNERMIEITEEVRFMLADVINYLETVEEQIGPEDKVWKLVNEAWELTTDAWIAAGGMDQPVVDEIPE